MYNGTIVKMLSLENSAGKGPQSFKNLAAGITIVATYKSTSGAIFCSYKRTITPPAVSSLMYYDVNTPHHVVYAFGNTVSGDEPSKHAFGDYGTTDKKVFVVRPQVRKPFEKFIKISRGSKVFSIKRIKVEVHQFLQAAAEI